MGVLTLFGDVTSLPMSLLEEVVEGELREKEGERREGGEEEREEMVGRFVVGVVRMLPGKFLIFLGKWFENIY